MLILLIGKYGQLGWELQRALAPLGEVVAIDYPEIDLVRLDDVQKLVQEINPHVGQTPLVKTTGIRKGYKMFV